MLGFYYAVGDLDIELKQDLQVCSVEMLQIEHLKHVS